MAMCARCCKIILVLMKMVLLSGTGLRQSVRNWFGSSLEPLRGSPLGSLRRRTPRGIGATAARRSLLRAVRGGHPFKGLVTAASHVSARAMDAEGRGRQAASCSLLFMRQEMEEAIFSELQHLLRSFMTWQKVARRQQGCPILYPCKGSLQHTASCDVLEFSVLSRMGPMLKTKSFAE